jgi:hypothetical protein
MPQSSRTFRIFVSSTFSDLKEERNALQEKVFPRLRDLAAEHSCRFQAIDLRWGVSEEASLDQQTMKICLGEIAHCQSITPRPNFIVLLGDRYGWCPLPLEIPAYEFEQIIENILDHGERCLIESWYSRDENAIPPTFILQTRTGEFIDSAKWTLIERSIHSILEREANKLHLSPEMQRKYSTSATEQEIMTGALGVKEVPDHVFCFFRTITGLPIDFNPLDFLTLVKAEVDKKFLGELDPSAQHFVNTILNLSTKSTAKDFAEFIGRGFQKNPKTKNEEEVLKFIRRLFLDFTAYDFQNLDENSWVIDDEALIKQKDLKKLLHDYNPQNIFTYQASWKSDDISKDHITQFCEDVYNSLSHIILDEIEHPHEYKIVEEKVVHIRPEKELDDEGFAHYKFAEDLLEFFVGRTEILKAIEDYLSNNSPHTLAIIGEGGTGKSALMAKAIQQTQEFHPKAKIVYRFIGATPSSSDGRNLLDSLCQEISRCYGASVTDIPSDYRDLVVEFGKRLRLANADQPLVLFLDSLDQLSTNQDVRNLIWLVNKLPEHVHVITSTRKDDTYKALQMKRATEMELGGLSDSEGNDLMSQWLASVHRTLQPPQRMEVMKKFEESLCNPLYLKLAFEEARLWASGSGQPPEDLEVGVLGIMERNMINRLTRESGHGEVMVSRTLGYLAASRYGLAEDELIDLLSRDLEVFSWFMENSHFFPADLIQSARDYLNDHLLSKGRKDSLSGNEEERTVLAWLNKINGLPEEKIDFLSEVLTKAIGPRLPIVLWSRLFFDLAPYLTEKIVDGSPLLNFYHRELGDVSKKVFLSKEKEHSYHSKLADFFQLKADPEGDRSWTGQSRHGLSELPYHLIKAAKFDDVFKTLTDFRFLEHKASEVGVQERKDENSAEVKFYSGVLQLQSDYEQAIGAMSSEEGPETKEERWPLIVTAVDSANGLSVYCPVCNKTTPIKKEALDTLISCPQEGCKTRLKINPFVIDRS